MKFEEPTVTGRINMIYGGTSMSPTLTVPALLEIVPYGRRSVQRGDVVVFRPPDGEGNVVHRVVSLHGMGIRTRGDASSRSDPYVVSPDNIIGQVVYARTGMKERRIHGGRLGRAIRRWLRLRLAVKKGVAGPLRSAYHLLARSGIFRIWIPARLRMRILAFNRPEGRELHLFMGRRLIGRLPSGEVSWLIKPPYRLFVDELHLPEAERESPQVPGDTTSPFNK